MSVGFAVKQHWFRSRLIPEPLYQGNRLIFRPCTSTRGFNRISIEGGVCHMCVHPSLSVKIKTDGRKQNETKQKKNNNINDNDHSSN